mgnify:CR=1 FL=1
MKTTIYYYVFFAIISITPSCEHGLSGNKHPIYIDNKSSHSIDFYLALGGKYGTIYPDTILPVSNDYLITDLGSGKRHYYDSSLPWEDYYKKNDKMSIFIFHSDTIEKYSWEEIRTGYKVLKRFDLSLKELQSTNYTVTYQ